MEQQLQNTLHDTTQDMTQDTTQDAVSDKQELDLINKMKDLMLEWVQNMPNMTDIPVPPLDAPETKHKGAKEDNPTMTYNMTNQEVRLQHEEEKYRIYMRTFSYKGDDSDLDSEMDTNSNATAYPFLD